jgi:hypothetical protein
MLKYTRARLRQRREGEPRRSAHTVHSRCNSPALAIRGCGPWGCEGGGGCQMPIAPSHLTATTTATKTARYVAAAPADRPKRPARLIQSANPEARLKAATGRDASCSAYVVVNVGWV